MALTMMATMSTAALAASAERIYETDSGLTGGTSQIMLQVKKAQDVLIATVPTELPIVIDTRGNITVPTTAKIVNNSDKKIKVTKIAFSTHNQTTTTKARLTVSNGWSSTTQDKMITIDFNGYSSRSGGVDSPYIDLSDSTKMGIEPKQELPLTMGVRCSKPVYSNGTYDSTKIGSAQFTIAFA